MSRIHSKVLFFPLLSPSIARKSIETNKDLHVQFDYARRQRYRKLLEINLIATRLVCRVRMKLTDQCVSGLKSKKA